MKQNFSSKTANVCRNVMMFSTLAFLMGMTNGSPLSGDGTCHLEILRDEFNQWHDVAEGFVYGMY